MAQKDLKNVLKKVEKAMDYKLPGEKNDRHG